MMSPMPCTVIGWLAWHFDELPETKFDDLPEEVDVLTPYSVVQTFSYGFRPEFHPSILE